MNTIRRNSKLIRSIFTEGFIAKAYTLNNGFSGTQCALDFVKKQYESMTFAKATIHNDVVTIHLHSNLWYELTPNQKG